ncbi:MAG: dUTP diphosphatase [Hydrogenothermaceae bacterium]|nr:dUTP diphosphatase [Hydrogenothermaceae bacterium]
MEEKIKECLKLQEELNLKINQNWRLDRKEEDFYRAIWLECAESMESLPWKWWKKMETDLENLEIEVADIFHFILSISLLKNDADLRYFKKAINSDFSNLEGIEGDYLNHYLADVYMRDKVDTYIFLIERVAEKSLRRDYNGTLFFFGLLVKELFDFNKLYLLYFGKNILNHIRQEMGYKTGDYKKVINGMEDNRYLIKLIQEIEDKNQLEAKIRELFESLTKEVN